MKKYRLRYNASGVINNETGDTILPDTNGMHWREYLMWMYAGNEPDPPIIPKRMPLPKSDIYASLTDEELELIFQARDSWPLRLRLMWDDAMNNMVSPDNELLIQFLDSVIGEERRKQVLGD